MCVRCNLAVETTVHRLWERSCNSTEQAALDAVCPGNSFPLGLPPCLLRCGIIPAYFQSNYGYTIKQGNAIILYLLRVNTIATKALADHRRGRPVKLQLDGPPNLPPGSIYKAALPPLKRLKAGDGQAAVRQRHGTPGGSQLATPLERRTQPHLSVLTPTESLVFSCDGSFCAQRDISGWGFCVAPTP